MNIEPRAARTVRAEMMESPEEVIRGAVEYGGYTFGLTELLTGTDEPSQYFTYTGRTNVLIGYRDALQGEEAVKRESFPTQRSAERHLLEMIMDM